MEFKKPELRQQLLEAPTLLRFVAQEFEWISRRYGKEPVVTRVTERIDGSSGVHSLGRAFDVRDVHGGKHHYTDAEREAIINHINAVFPRKDGYKTCIWHSFQGGPGHFHCQVSADTMNHGVEL